MLTRKEQIQIDLVEARAKKDLLYARFVREMDLNNEHIKDLENELANIEQRKRKDSGGRSRYGQLPHERED